MLIRPLYGRFVLALYLVLLLVLTLAPVPATPAFLPDWSDKAVHFMLFVGFAALLAWSLDGPRGDRWLPVVLIGTGLAAAIELVQGPLPFRSASWSDLGWGGLGTAGGYAVTMLLDRMASRR